MYYDQMETWYDVYKSDLKNVFYHHYIAYLANFRTKNRGFLFAHFQIIIMPFLLMSEGESKNDHEISGMYTYFCVAMET